MVLMGVFIPMLSGGLKKTLPDALDAAAEVKEAVKRPAKSTNEGAKDPAGTEKPKANKVAVKEDENAQEMSLSFVKYLLFFPGYLTLAVAYFFPNESFGKNRNVAASARQWRRRDFFAVVNSLAIYFFIYVFFLAK